MCEPATIALAVGLAGTAVSAYSANEQGKYQSKVANNNAKLQEYAADDAMKRGAIEEQQQRDKTRQFLGMQRASMAANGLDTSGGTGALLLADTAQMGEFDAQTVRNNAMKAAWGNTTQAGFTRSDGQMAKTAGQMNAAGTLLTSGSNAYGQYRKAK